MISEQNFIKIANKLDTFYNKIYPTLIEKDSSILCTIDEIVEALSDETDEIFTKWLFDENTHNTMSSQELYNFICNLKEY